MATTNAEQSAGALFVDTNVLVYPYVSEAPQNDAALGTIERAHKDGRALRLSRKVLHQLQC